MHQDACRNNSRPTYLSCRRIEDSSFEVITRLTVRHKSE